MTETRGRVAASGVPWYRALDRGQWRVLLASNLGWLFDGYEAYGVILAVGPALRELLPPSEAGRAPVYAGATVAATLLGWGLGGTLGGVLADYLGRKRTMVLAIGAYSVSSAWSALAWSWPSFVALRFAVGVAIGSEWVTGASMVAELWPPHARARGVGLMQCGLGLGFFLSSIAWLAVSGAGAAAWRLLFLLGALPALLTLWLRRALPESALWAQSRERRARAAARLRSGAELDAAERALVRFTLADLFHERERRRRVLVAFTMSLATTFAFWGVTTWVPPYVASVVAGGAASAARWAGYAALAYNGGAIGGYVAFGFLADAWGRRRTTLAYYAGALLFTLVLFLFAHDRLSLLVAAVLLGWFAAGQFTWMGAWLPELLPTRVRATGAAFVFNGPRFIAWVGPLLAGEIIVALGGFKGAAVTCGSVYLLGLAAAPLLPETLGQPLPED